MNIAIIGGGPGGYVAAIRAAQLGARVQLIERDKLGGTCLNYGCIPTKALLHAAEVFTQAKHGSRFGVMAEPTVDFSRTVTYKNETVKKLVRGVENLMRANKIEVIYGDASFSAQKILKIKRFGDSDLSLSPDRIIIATGSKPSIPPIPGIDSPFCLDSTGALALETVPARLAIIGGGVIGVEIATVFSAFGSEVTVIEMQDEILPMMDRELTGLLRVKLQASGISIITGARVLRIEDGNGQSRITYETATGEYSACAEKILVSTGRKISTDSLNLAAAGIKNERGRILVNNRQETNVPGVFAIGDCTGGVMLAHAASAQGEIAAENAMGHEAVYNAKTNPFCVYTTPEFAGVGLTTEEARAAGMDIKIGRFPLSANGKAQITGTDGMIKVLSGNKYREILGVHILAPRATDLISSASVLIGLEATLDEVAGIIFAHPTYGEALREAALVSAERPVHIPRPFV